MIFNFFLSFFYLFLYLFSTFFVSFYCFLYSQSKPGLQILKPSVNRFSKTNDNILNFNMLVKMPQSELWTRKLRNEYTWTWPSIPYIYTYIYIFEISIWGLELRPQRSHTLDVCPVQVGSSGHTVTCACICSRCACTRSSSPNMWRGPCMSPSEAYDRSQNI